MNRLLKRSASKAGKRANSIKLCCGGYNTAYHSVSFIWGTFSSYLAFEYFRKLESRKRYQGEAHILFHDAILAVFVGYVFDILWPVSLPGTILWNGKEVYF